VFDLFNVPGDHRTAVLAFLAERAPELGYERAKSSGKVQSSLGAVAGKLTAEV
jgi:hypothetical protein